MRAECLIRHYWLWWHYWVNLPVGGNRRPRRKHTMSEGVTLSTAWRHLDSNPEHRRWQARMFPLCHSDNPCCKVEGFSDSDVMAFSVVYPIVSFSASSIIFNFQLNFIQIPISFDSSCPVQSVIVNLVHLHGKERGVLVDLGSHLHFISSRERLINVRQLW